MPYETECIIAEQIKVRKKTSKWKLIDWIYEKLYGYEYKSVFPDGCHVMMFDGKLMFRDQETYDRVKDFIENRR